MSGLSPSQRIMLAEQRRRAIEEELADLDAIGDDWPAVELEVRLTVEHLRELGLLLPGGWVGSEGLACWLGVAEGTVRNWRTAGTGPRWRVRGGVVAYHLADVVAWGRRYTRGRRVGEPPRHELSRLVAREL